MGNGGHPGKLQNNATDLFPRLGTGGFEDPFLYRDNHGGFHCLVHSMVGDKTCHRLGAMDGRGSCGAHLFSVDGVHWSTHATSGAYTGLIQYMYESSSLGESMGENSGEKLGESLGESLEGESLGEKHHAQRRTLAYYTYSQVTLESFAYSCQCTLLVVVHSQQQPRLSHVGLARPPHHLGTTV